MNSIFELISYDRGAMYVFHRMKHIFTEMHWHRELEIVYVIKGSIRVRNVDKDLKLNKGQILLLNSSQTHALNSIENQDADIVVLQISEELISNMGQSSKSLYFSSIIDSEEDDTHSDASKSLFQCIENIIELMDNEQLNTKQINLLCMRLMTIIIQNFSTPISEKNLHYDERHPQQIKRIISYIEDSFANSELDLSGAAAVLGMNPTYMSRLFSMYTNTTFVKYLNNYRITRVCRELMKSEDSITDIYLRNGFSNGKTFNRVFKELIGATPTEYRNDQQIKSNFMGLPGATIKTSVGSYVNFSDIKDDASDVLRRDYLLNQPQSSPQISPNEVDVKTIKASINASQSPLNKPFKKLICTGRAYDLLQHSWREHFETCHKEMPFEYLRFHGIFDDEMGIIHKKGNFMDYNFFYIDKAIKYMLSLGVKPYLELSFMPDAIASKHTEIFSYKANISKPDSMEQWEKMLEAFIRHLIRYFGKDEVASWYFDVWNEPDIADFWADEYSDYLELYKTSYRVIKRIEPELRVGGPSGSSIIFQEKDKYILFIQYCKMNSLIPDFVSLHPYPVRFWKDCKSYEELQEVYPSSYTVANMKWARAVLEENDLDNVPVHMNEWNSSPRYDDYIHDTAYMATYVIDTVLKCRDMCDVLGWWTVSDLFDEGGPAYKEFGGGFGLLNRDGLKKPAYWGMWALFKLCRNVVQSGDDYIITRDGDRTVVLLWNYAFFKADFAGGDRTALSYYNRYDVFEIVPLKKFRLSLDDFGGKTLMISRHQFSKGHGSIFDFWLKCGAIEYLNDEQLDELKANNHLKVSRFFQSDVSRLNLEEELKQFSFVLYEINEME